METQQFPMEEEQEEAVGVVGEKDERPLYERIAAFLKRVWGPFLISAVAEWPGNYLAQKEDEFFAHFERIVALAPPEGASGAIDEEMSALLREAGDEAEATPEENETSQQQRRLIALCIFVQNFLYLSEENPFSPDARSGGAGAREVGSQDEAGSASGEEEGAEGGAERHHASSSSSWSGSAGSSSSSSDGDSASGGGPSSDSESSSGSDSGEGCPRTDFVLDVLTREDYHGAMRPLCSKAERTMFANAEKITKGNVAAFLRILRQNVAYLMDGTVPPLPVATPPKPKKKRAALEPLENKTPSKKSKKT